MAPAPVRALSVALALAGGLLLAAFAISASVAPAQSAVQPKYRVVVPALSAGKFPPPPTPTPTPVFGTPATLRLASGGITMSPQIEARHTVTVAGKEYFDVPTQPSRVAWYEAFGDLGRAGSTTLLAAHINYAGYGAGPFARLTSATVGDTITLTDTVGRTLVFSVQSVQVIKLANLDMNQVVYPTLGAGKERLTLISCGGTFVPNPSGVGGQYDSRVILVGERYVE